MTTAPPNPISNDRLTECLRLVSGYIEPNPVVYCRLASVSRVFFQKFTSDDTWKYLNPYGWESNIYRQFIERCRDEHSLMVKYWSNKRTHYNLQEKLEMENLGAPVDKSYLQLGFVLYTVLGPNVPDQFQHNHIVNSRDIMWCAIHISPSAFELASDELARDRELVVYALSRNSDVFWNVDETLQNDPDIVWIAIRQRTVIRFPSHLEGVSPALAIAPIQFRRDKRFVLEAVKYNPEALQFASEELQNDNDVVMAAVTANRAKLVEVSPDVFIEVPVLDTRSILMWASERLRRNAAIADSGLVRDRHENAQAPQYTWNIEGLLAMMLNAFLRSVA